MPKPVSMMKGHTDLYYTPSYAIDILLPYLDKSWTIWEPACGLNNITQYLKDNGYTVVSSDIEEDFMTTKKSCDAIVTNPPYSIKDLFLRRCYEIGLSFAMLLPLTALESENRQWLYREFGLQLIIPNKRVNFITSDGSGSGSWFATAWFTMGLNLPSDLTFVILNK